MVLLQYVGGNYGDQTWWGEATGQRYVFGLSRPKGYVDAKDAKALLATRQNRKVLFQIAPQPLPQPEVPVERQVEANPEPEVEPEPMVLVTHAITTKAQQVAEDLGIDWTRIVGTGRDNKVTVRDVRAIA